MKTQDHESLQWMKSILWLLWRLTLCIGSVVGTLYIMGRLKIVIIYIIVGVIMAYVMRPLATQMMNRGILVKKTWKRHTQRSLATLWVLIVLMVGGYYAGRFMLSPFVAQIKDVSTNWESEYQPKFQTYSATVREWYVKSVKPEWRTRIEESFSHGTGSSDLQKGITTWLGGMAEHAGGLAHQVVEIVLLPVLAYYFALDSRKLKHDAIALLPRKYLKETARMIHEFNLIMHSYVIGQAILCALAGVVVGLLLAALHVPYALTLGVLAGVTRAIPIVGPILGGIPIIALTFVTAGPGTAVGVLAVFTFMHFAESKFVMPMLIGERMELHPVVIIIVLLVGQEFGGLLGMFFAAPLAAILRVILRRYYLKTYLKKRSLGAHVN